MKLRYPLLLLLALWAAPASGQGGINLAWNDCGLNGQTLATFACNSNAGFHVMYPSFVSPVPLTQLNGIEVVIDVAFPQPTTPSWWMAQSSGGACRTNVIQATADFLSGPSSCIDPWQGVALATAIIQPDFPLPGRARLRAIAALPSASMATIDDVSQYYAPAIRVFNSKTVGAGSCSGCDVPACIAITSIKLTQPAGVGDYTFANPLDNTLIGWQCAANTGHGGCFFVPPCVTAAKAPTWGSVKSLYR